MPPPDTGVPGSHPPSSEKKHPPGGGWYWLQPLLDIFYPLRCAACSARIPEGRHDDFCPPCTEKLKPVNAPFCSLCCEPFPGDLDPGFTCLNCFNNAFAFDFAVSAWQSEGSLREAIHRFKYQKRIHLRQPLAHKLHDALADPRLTGARAPEAAESWVIIPVPLHSRRQRERGFNQSAELSRQLAKLSGLPCLEALRRSRYTTAQAALNRKQRLANLAGAFAISPKFSLSVKKKNVLLVDDVFTTGSTAHECSRVLKAADAGLVIVLTVAR